MGVFDIEIKQEGKGNTIYRDLSRTYGGYRRRSYENYRQIAKEGYLANHVVFRCIGEIQNAANKIEFKVYRRTKNGKEIVNNHPLEQLICQPNKSYYGNELIDRAILFYYISGNVPFRNIKLSFSNRLYVHRPDRIEYMPTGDELRPYKDIYYCAASRTKIEEEEFFIWKNYNPLDELDGLGYGISNLSAIFSKIDQYKALTTWNLSLLENGGHLSGVISTDDALDEDVYKRITEEIKQSHQGTINTGKFMFLEGGAKFTATSNTPKDMDYNDLELNVIKAIHSCLKVDPILTGYSQFSTYNNKAEASKELYRKTAVPLLLKLADVFNMYYSNNGLLRKEEYVGLDLSNVEELQKDKKEIVERLSKKTALTENEKRAEQGLEPIKGLDIIAGDGYFHDGKQLYIPSNMVPATVVATGESKSLFGNGDEGAWY